MASEELEKALKLTKNGKSPGEDNINSDDNKHSPVDFRLRLLQFLSNMYTRNCIQSEWRNAVVITLFKKGDRRD
jgi:hypothetical protein